MNDDIRDVVSRYDHKQVYDDKSACGECHASIRAHRELRNARPMPPSGAPESNCGTRDAWCGGAGRSALCPGEVQGTKEDQEADNRHEGLMRGTSFRMLLWRRGLEWSHTSPHGVSD